jgi:hypothetical protein
MQIVREMLDELADGCAAWWVTRCQWTGVAMPIIIAAMGGGEEGLEILKRCGFQGEQGDWDGYRKWLGLRYQRRLWGENVSNSMIVLVSVILYVKESR